MSDTAPAESAAVEAPPAPAASPIPLSAFAPAVQKSIDPKSPLPLRMMSSKGLIPAGPRDVLTGLFVLTFDPEPKVVESARATSAKLHDKYAVGLRDEELHPEVLNYFATVLKDADQYLEFIVLNPAASDAAVATIAGECSEKVGEVLAGNQLRILRDEAIVRALVRNPRIRASTKDNVLDFCVRSGMVVADLPEYQEAKRRILGVDPEAHAAIEAAEAMSAEAVMKELGDVVTKEGEPEPDDQKKLTITQAFMKMSVAQKIKFGTLGNKEARTLCLRDSNKLVALAAIGSPRLTDGEVGTLSKARTLHEDVMRFIIGNREWTKSYEIKKNLVNNPKCPPAIALKFMQHLHPGDLKDVARNKNIAAMLQTQARMMLQKKESGQKK